MLTKERKKEIIEKFGGPEKKSGLPEVQIAILTERIGYLTPHFNEHKHDFHSMRGMKKLIGQRRALLRYLNGKSPERYQKVIKELKLRK